MPASRIAVAASMGKVPTGQCDDHIERERFHVSWVHCGEELDIIGNPFWPRIREYCRTHGEVFDVAIHDGYE